MLTRALIFWLGLFVLAFVNGALPEVGMKKALAIGEPLAHRISCFTRVALWTTITWVFWDFLRVEKMIEAAVIGALWFVGAVLVETFLINRKQTWREVFQTYNVFDGEFWGLVLLWVGLMPVLIFNLKIDICGLQINKI